ncbi:MAG TPA: TonB-dependent receptor [Blastocatellia bacterium]|nr:TonB-dependent receptor [Blastocatellia bacterium]
MRHKFRFLLMAALMLSFLVRMSFPVFAQNPTGSVRGTVTDPQGAVIANANITVTNKATGDVRRANTGNDGIYLVSTLLPGEYELKVEAQNFSTQILNVVVQVGTTSTGDVEMRIGASNEIVDVVAEAPIIDKENYKLDGVITRQKIDALPLNGRNFLQLAMLEPGVGVSTSSPGNANNLFNVSIGGASSADTRITVDGGSVVDYVTGGAGQNFSTETIQEFQISTFNFDLSTGVTSVGAVNIVSRTGTNGVHGSALYFFRDKELSAVPTLGVGKFGAPDFRRSQYGGSIGGPIKKDRAFFFANAEWLNQDSVFASVNTGFGGPTVNPNIILNDVSQFDTAFKSPYDGVVFNLRGDFKLTNKHNLFARYSLDDNEAFAPVETNVLPSNWRINSNRSTQYQFGLTSIFTSNVVNDFRYNFQNIKNDSLLPTEAECPDCLGLQGVQIRINGSSLRLGNQIQAPQDRDNDRHQFTDNVNWQKGAHRIRFGGEYEYDWGTGSWAFLTPALIILHNPNDVIATNLAVNTFLPGPVRPLYNIPLPASFTTPGATITYSDLLQLPIAFAVAGIGNPLQPPPFNRDIARRSDRYRFYAQDSWQAFKGFTFSYGASYLYETNLFNHDLSKPALIQPLSGSLAPSPKDKNNIAPALGFAWDVANKGKTVIRGGAGMFYDTSLFVTRLRERSAIGPANNGRSQVVGAFFQNPIPFTRIPGIPEPLASINPPIGKGIDFQVIPTKFTGQNFLDLLNAQVPLIENVLDAVGSAGFTSLDFFKTGTDLLDQGNVTPYSLQFTIGFQHQLPHNMAISVDLVSRNRVHLLSPLLDYNYFNRPEAFGGQKIRKCVGAEAADPTAQCSNGPISFISSNGREQYRGLHVKFDKRFSSRFQFTASYALSSLRGFFQTEDLNNWFANSGNLGGDVRHRFTFSGVVDLPGGFQASLISVLQSRPPFTATINSTNDINGDGVGGDTLPGLERNSLNRGVGKEEFIRLVNEFNARRAGKLDARGATIRALVLPTDFDFGDNFQSHDVRISKIFRFGERFALQGMFEVFNIFNTANLTGYSTTIGSGFGRPTERAGQAFGTGGPRAIQLGGRFTF